MINPLIDILRGSGTTLYKEIDLYIFFIKLLNNSKIRNYILSNQIHTNTPILNFMSANFKNVIINSLSKNDKFISMNETTYLIIETYDKIKEPMNTIFTNDYITSLNEFTKL